MTIRRHNLVDVEATLIHETPAAYLINNGGKDNVWVPKAVTEYDPDEGIFTMPESLALEKGLI